MVMVGCCLQDGLEKLKAGTYVWGNSNDTYLYGDWDFEVKWSLFFCCLYHPLVFFQQHSPRCLEQK